MKRALKTAAACLALTLTIGASAESCEETPQQKRLAKCETAFRAEYKRVLESDEYDAGRPPAICYAIPKRDRVRITKRVILEETPRLDGS